MKREIRADGVPSGWKIRTGDRERARSAIACWLGSRGVAESAEIAERIVERGLVRADELSLEGGRCIAPNGSGRADYSELEQVLFELGRRILQVVPATLEVPARSAAVFSLLAPLFVGRLLARGWRPESPGAEGLRGKPLRRAFFEVFQKIRLPEGESVLEAAIADASRRRIDPDRDSLRGLMQNALYVLTIA